MHSLWMRPIDGTQPMGPDGVPARREQSRRMPALPPGILCIDKPEGVTSHDVVDFVRAVTGERRVGHCGTLDPLATGLLPLAIGTATRLAEYVTGSSKDYVVQVEMGRRTDTGDITGTTLEESSGPWPTRERVEHEVGALAGTRKHRPPAFSAVRVGGRRLHELARAGQLVDAPERTVVIESALVLAYEPPRLVFRLRCSKGTYVRTLVTELGGALGVPATVGALRRHGCGSLSLADAHTPFAAMAAAVALRLPELYIPWERALAEHEALRLLPGRALSLLLHGTAVPVKALGSWTPRREHVVLLDGAGLPLAVCDVSSHGGHSALCPVKILARVERD